MACEEAQQILLDRLTLPNDKPTSGHLGNTHPEEQKGGDIVGSVQDAITDNAS